MVHDPKHPASATLRILIAASLLASQAGAIAPVTARPDVQTSLDRVTATMGLAHLDFAEVPAGSAEDGQVGDRTVQLSAQTLALAHDRKELEALLAILVGLRTTPAQLPPESPSLGSYLAAGAVAYAGGKLDRVDRTDVGTRNRQSFQPPAQNALPSLAQRRSAVVLAAMNRLATCSGAAVVVLNRVKDRNGGFGPHPLQAIDAVAERFTRDLSPLIYPPDNSCL